MTEKALKIIPSIFNKPTNSFTSPNPSFSSGYPNLTDKRLKIPNLASKTPNSLAGPTKFLRIICCLNLLKNCDFHFISYVHH